MRLADYPDIKIADEVLDLISGELTASNSYELIFGGEQLYIDIGSWVPVELPLEKYGFKVVDGKIYPSDVWLIDTDAPPAGLLLDDQNRILVLRKRFKHPSYKRLVVKCFGFRDLDAFLRAYRGTGFKKYIELYEQSDYIPTVTDDVEYLMLVYGLFNYFGDVKKIRNMLNRAYNHYRDSISWEEELLTIRIIRRLVSYFNRHKDDKKYYIDRGVIVVDDHIRKVINHVKEVVKTCER